MSHARCVELVQKWELEANKADGLAQVWKHEASNADNFAYESQADARSDVLRKMAVDFRDLLAVSTEPLATRDYNAVLELIGRAKLALIKDEESRMHPQPPEKRRAAKHAAVKNEAATNDHATPSDLAFPLDFQRLKSSDFERWGLVTLHTLESARLRRRHERLEKQRPMTPDQLAILAVYDGKDAVGHLRAMVEDNVDDGSLQKAAYVQSMCVLRGSLDPEDPPAQWNEETRSATATMMWGIRRQP